jgi:hypothetical protein
VDRPRYAPSSVDSRRRHPVAEPPHVRDLHQDARLREHRAEEPVGSEKTFSSRLRAWTLRCRRYS